MKIFFFILTLIYGLFVTTNSGTLFARTYDLGSLKCTESKSYNGVDSPIYSPDGKHFAFIAFNGKNAYVVRDGRIGKKYSQIQHLEYSPNSNKLSYLATNERGGTILVLDGKELDAYQLTYSPDGKHFAYVVGDSEYIIKDGKKIEKGNNDWLSDPTFSPDGNHFAYIISKDEKRYAILDGIKSMTGYEAILYPVFSPDSKIFAYTASKGSFLDTVVVKNGVESKSYATINNSTNIHTLLFSSDSMSSAFVAKVPIMKNGVTDYKQIIVKDGVDIDTYDDADEPSYSSDSKHFSYIAEKNGKKILVKDGIESSILRTQTSPDGKSTAYFSNKNGEVILIKDGVDITGNYIFVASEYLYSPDSKSFAFTAHRDNDRKRVLVKDGKESKSYNDIKYPAYSPDGKHFSFIGEIYGGSNLENKYVVVTDGIESPLYDDAIPVYTPNLFFSPNGKDISFAAKMNKKYLIVTCRDLK